MGFDELKADILRLAKADLEKRNANYVNSFYALLGKGEGGAGELRRPESQLIGNELKDWHPILKALMRVESCRDKVRTALKLFTEKPPHSYLESLGIDQGRWMSQQSDSWLINLHAMLERFEDLGKVLIRRFAKPRKPEGLLAEKGFTNEMQKLLQIIEPIRNRAGHGLEYFEALEEENLWVPYVLLEGNVDLLGEMYSDRTKYHENWAVGFRQTSIQALAQIEALSGKLNVFVPGATP